MLEGVGVVEEQNIQVDVEQNVGIDVQQGVRHPNVQNV